jgi:hypothetical protein
LLYRRRNAASSADVVHDDLLRLTAGVDIGGVDEVDPRIEGTVNDLDRCG